MRCFLESGWSGIWIESVNSVAVTKPDEHSGRWFQGAHNNHDEGCQLVARLTKHVSKAVDVCARWLCLRLWVRVPIAYVVESHLKLPYDFTTLR